MNKELEKAFSYGAHVAKDYYYRAIPGACHIITKGKRAGELDPTYEAFISKAREIVIECSENYDPKKSNGATLMTYCRKPLEKGLQEFVRSEINTIRVNKTAQAEARRCRALQRRMEDPSYKELAEVMGITEAHVGELLTLPTQKGVSSLDEGIPIQGSPNIDGKGDDERECTPYSHDVVACTKYPNPEKTLMMKEGIIKRVSNDRGSIFDKKRDNFDVYGENWFQANYGPMNDRRGRVNGPNEYLEEGECGYNSSIHVYKNRREGFSYKLFKTDNPLERRVVFYLNGKPYEERLMHPGTEDIEDAAYDHMMFLVQTARKFGGKDKNGKLTFKKADAKGLLSKELTAKTLDKYIYKVKREVNGTKIYECRSWEFVLLPGDQMGEEPSPASTAPKPNPNMLHMVLGERGACPTRSNAFSQPIGTVERSDLALLNTLEWIYGQTNANPITREEA